MRLPARLKWITTWLASTQCAVVLFLALAALAIPGTFSESRALYSSPPFLFLLLVFALNLVLCTVQKIKTISAPVLVLHGGVLLTLGGCFATSFGYVATVNMYEGTSVDQFFRWDTEQDANLGFNLALQKINIEYYPTPVKVGVLRGQQKDRLFVLKTGESFDYDNYRIKVDSILPEVELLRLSIFQNDKKIGTCSTADFSELPPGFPYHFKLVAFQKPHLKRMWVDLKLTREGQVVEGVAEVNNPLRWNGLYFFNTQVERDPAGTPYAGIQVVRDPGRPLVFTGFAIMGLGAVLSFNRRFFRKGQWKI